MIDLNKEWDRMIEAMRFTAFHEAGHVVARHHAGYSLKEVVLEYILGISSWAGVTRSYDGEGRPDPNIPMAGYAATHLALHNGQLGNFIQNDEEHFMSSGFGLCADARSYLELVPGTFTMQPRPDTGNDVSDNLKDFANNQSALKVFEKTILKQCVPYLRGKWNEVICVADVLNAQAKCQIDDEQKDRAVIYADLFTSCLY